MSMMDKIRMGVRRVVGERCWARFRFLFRHALPVYLPRLVRFRMTPPHTPDELFLFLTNRCNARCKHCFYINELGDTSGELSLEEWSTIARGLPRLEHITLTGGEALLRTDVFEIASVLCEYARPKVLTIISNGLRPDELDQFAGEWLQQSTNSHPPILDILISLDGMESTHNEIRGHANAWTNAVSSIKRMAVLRDQNLGKIDVGIVTIITEKSCDELEILADYIRRELNVRQGFEFIRSSATSVWGLSPEMKADFIPSTLGLPPLERLDSIVATLRKLNRQAGKNANYEFFVTNVLSARMLQGDQRAFLPCVAAGITTAVVYPNGDMAACEFMKPFGNLKSDFGCDFMQAWTSPQLQSCREASRCCCCTHGCYLSRSIALSPRGLWHIWREL